MVFHFVARMRAFTPLWLDKATKKGNWSKSDQELYDFTKYYNPFIGLYKDKYERERYFERYGLDYSDVVQPWNLTGGSEASLAGKYVSRGMNYVSHNVADLYEESEDRAVKKKKAFYSYQDAWH